MLKTLANITFFVVGIILIFVVMNLFGFEQISTQLMKTDIELFLIAVVIQVIIMMLFGMRMKIIAGSYPPLEYFKALKVVIVGNVVSMITPVLRVGGEPIKINILKPIYGLSKSIAIVTIDTFSEIISFYGVVLVTMIFIVFGNILPFGMVSQFIFLFAISFFILTAVLFMCFNEKMLRRMTCLVKRIISRFRKMEKSSIDYVARFKKYIGLLTRNRNRLYAVVVITIVLRTLEILRMWIIFLALGYEIQFSILIFAWTFILLLSLIPWLPGGLGLIEAGGASIFTLFSIDISMGASVMILDRLVSFWFVLIPSMMYISITARGKISMPKKRYKDKKPTKSDLK